MTFSCYGNAQDFCSHDIDQVSQAPSNIVNANDKVILELDNAASQASATNDYKTAFKDWSIAAAQGNAVASCELGFLYYTGDVGPTVNPLDPRWAKINSINNALSLKWFIKAAQQGNKNAQLLVAINYKLGLSGVPKNYTKAAYWYTKSAIQGESESQYSLAKLYIEGHGVPQNYSLAAKWCLKSAEQGHYKAQLLMGGIYEEGQGVTQNYVSAYKWYILSEADADADADAHADAAGGIDDEIDGYEDALSNKMTPEQVNQAQQEASAWFDNYQKKSKVKTTIGTSEVTRTRPDSEVQAAQSNNSYNEDYYLRHVLGPNGHIDKALHDQFWQQFNGESEHDVTLAINWIKGSILVTQEFEKELWKSALLSYNNHEIIETERLIQLEKETPEMAKKSLPWPPGSSQYTDALASFNSGWTTSMEDAKRLLNAAANHKPFVAVNGTEVQLDEHIIEQTSSSIDASISRLNKLLDRNWNGN